ncbi:glycosyltransferase family 2 protein [Cupriavidus sp. 8B]
MDYPLISVIIPCYNHEKYVEQAIASVLAQSYPNVELIVIDDGSKDGSVKLLTELAARHGFRFVSQSNRGVCRTFNRAIREFSTGEYVALLASDDYWQAEKLAKQMALLAASPAAEFCFTQAQEFADDGRLLRIFPAKPKTGKVTSQVFLRQGVPAGSMLFSRKLYDKLDGFDESLKEEDWDFVIRCSAETEFVAVREPLFYYRWHQGNTMKTRGRAEIFRQKALILSKNFHLVSPQRWFLAMSIHFAHDIFLARMLGK